MRDPALSPLKAAPKQGIETLRREWMARLAMLIEWARGVAPDAWELPVEYAQSSGKPLSSTGREIVLHLVNHGTLHRGQVMAMFRQVGAKPPATDLIFYFRERAANAVN